MNTHRKNHRHHGNSPVPLLLLVVAVAALAGGCQLLNSAANNSSCVDHSTNYTTALADEGQLSTDVATATGHRGKRLMALLLL